MNKKGFTLVELLAIIIVLAVIIVIAAPNMTKQIKKNEEETQNILNQKIENASKLYAAKYHANEIVKGVSFSFTLSDLENDGLLDLKDKCSGQKEAPISYNGVYNYENISDNGKDCYK